MKSLVSILLALAILSLPAVAAADSLYGRCIGKGGEKCETHHRISTSWNSNTGHIDHDRGTYDLDLGGKVDQTITVYCDGDSVGTVKVSGRTEFTVRCD